MAGGQDNLSRYSDGGWKLLSNYADTVECLAYFVRVYNQCAMSYI